MGRRFISIWFQHLTTDWFIRRDPLLATIPFVLSATSHGRQVIVATTALAQSIGIYKDMAVADARAIHPTLKVLQDKPDLSNKLLKNLAVWCIRFTPFVSIDILGGLVLDVTGCSHLWGGDENYIKEIIKRFKGIGYTTKAAMADTIGAAWAVARYGTTSNIIEKGKQVDALLCLPPEALRLDADTIERLHKLGLRQIKDFLSMPRYALRRRFGAVFIRRLNEALGVEEEIIEPVHPIKLYEERLPCLDPIVTRAGIEIALQRLIEGLCDKLQREQKGLRHLSLTSHRIDGNVQLVYIETGSPSHNARHLLKLFETKLCSLQPGLGIEVFILEAKNIEEHSPAQEKIWGESSNLNHHLLSELLDRLAVRIGANNIHRYLPAEHYLPERSFKTSSSFFEKSITEWKIERPRPLQLLSPPQQIEVTAPIPDYPPMLFRYKGKLHKIIKADGPERIEQEWWIKEGRHRDYYYVEDEEGCRYWLFRSGHYTEDRLHKWFIHGFFA